MTQRPTVACSRQTWVLLLNRNVNDTVILSHRRAAFYRHRLACINAWVPSGRYALRGRLLRLAAVFFRRRWHSWGVSPRALRVPNKPQALRRSEQTGARARGCQYFANRAGRRRWSLGAGLVLGTGACWNHRFPRHVCGTRRTIAAVPAYRLLCRCDGLILSWLLFSATLQQRYVLLYPRVNIDRFLITLRP